MNLDLKPQERRTPLRVEDMIAASPLADTADFRKKPGTPPKQRETNDENDVISHLRGLNQRLEAKKQIQYKQAKKGDIYLRTMLFLRLFAASAFASKMYFIMEGTKEFLIGILIFMPVIAALRWALKAQFK